MHTPFTVGWWNEFAAAVCGSTPVLKPTKTEAMIVAVRPDRSAEVHVWEDKIEIPHRLVRPLLGGLYGLDVVALPPDETGHHVAINDELALELQPDAALVIVIGGDADPCHAIEIPGTQIERLKSALIGMLA